MDITIIEARDLNEAWWKCIREVLTKGYSYIIDTGSYAGQRRKEFDFVVVHIKNPSIRPLVPTVPEGVPPPTNIKYVEEDYLPYLMSNLKQANETYTYGEDIEQQLLKVIDIYKSGFNTNQATITIGNRDSIYLSDPPCLRIIDTRVRYGKLHFIVYFRSWDLYAGFPNNLAGIQLMKEFMASEIGVEDGELIAVSKGLHLYEHNWEVAKIVAGL